MIKYYLCQGPGRDLVSAGGQAGPYLAKLHTWSLDLDIDKRGALLGQQGLLPEGKCGAVASLTGKEADDWHEGFQGRLEAVGAKRPTLNCRHWIQMTHQQVAFLDRQLVVALLQHPAMLNHFHTHPTLRSERG